MCLEETSQIIPRIFKQKHAWSSGHASLTSKRLNGEGKPTSAKHHHEAWGKRGLLFTARCEVDLWAAGPGLLHLIPIAWETGSLCIANVQFIPGGS